MGVIVATVKGEDRATGYIRDPNRHIGAQKRDFTKATLKRSWMGLPKEYDLRKIGQGAPPIRDQGSCGSCWAFGSTDAVEGTILQRDGHLNSLSQQKYVDCFYSGCGGGDFAQVLNSMKLPAGVVYASEYVRQYDARDHSCASASTHESIDWAFIGNSVEEMKTALYENQAPLGVTTAGGCINAGKDGIISGCRECGTNHIESVYGWFIDKNNVERWIKKNSWGTSYGDKGWGYPQTRGSDGTICSSVGLDEVVQISYKSACQPVPTSNAGPDKSLVVEN